jgi:hypothetical protein
MPQAKASPRAIATPMRIPVKAPGPMVVEIKFMSLSSIEDSLKMLSIIGNNSSECPRLIILKRLAIVMSFKAMAAEQLSREVSKLNIFILIL